MSKKSKDEINKEAWHELVELNQEMLKYFANWRLKKEYEPSLTLANDLDLGAIQRIRKLVQDEANAIKP